MIFEETFELPGYLKAKATVSVIVLESGLVFIKAAFCRHACVGVALKCAASEARD